MAVDVSNPAAHESVPFDKDEHFVISRYGRFRQPAKQFEHVVPIVQIAACQFTDDHGVNQYLVVVQEGH